LNVIVGGEAKFYPQKKGTGSSSKKYASKIDEPSVSWRTSEGNGNFQH